MHKCCAIRMRIIVFCIDRFTISAYNVVCNKLLLLVNEEVEADEA